MMVADLRTIPAIAELAERAQWVVWAPILKNGKGKPDKVPFRPNGIPASCTKRASWTTLDEARAAVERGQLCTLKDMKTGEVIGKATAAGPGFTVTETDPYVMVDLDGCIGPDGTIEPWALDIADRLRSYTEVSPSDRGLRIIVRGTLPIGGGRRGNVEVYAAKRFCTITGKALDDWPNEIVEDQAALDWLWRTHIDPDGSKAAKGANGHGHNSSVVSLDARAPQLVSAKLELLLDSVPNARATWEAQREFRKTDGSPNWSSHDMALANMAVRAGWSDEEIWGLIAAFRAKHGAAPKDQRRSYIEETIAEARAKTGTLVLDPTDPYRNAQLFLEQRYADPSGPLLRHHKGDFYRHAGTHWAAIEDAALRSQAYAWLARASCLTDKGARPFKPTTRRTNDFLDGLKAAAHLDGGTTAPAWMPGGDGPLPADELVPMQNGLLHLATGALLQPTPRFFNTHVLPFDYDPVAPEPKAWLDFLASIWPDDQEAQGCLQEKMGYLISGDRRQQKVFLVVGPMRSGKGTIARVIRSLIGAENVAGPTLADLASNFGLAPLIGKSVAIIADARLSGRTDATVIAERLLSISGEDAITIDRKHREHWTGTLPTRFVLLTNELPKIADASGALASRFVVLTMTRSFLGREDHDLADRLLAELPGIFNWALEGRRRLSERGRFVMPASSAAAVEDIDALSSPIRAFLKARCRIEPGANVECAELYEDWCGWCEAQGRREPGTTQMFGRDLRAAVPGLKITFHRHGGPLRRFYEGVGLR